MHSAYMSGEGYTGSSLSILVFSIEELANRHLSWVLLRHIGDGHRHVYHQPAHRRALNDALTASCLFICSLTVPTSSGRYLFVSYYDITNLERTLSFTSRSSTVRHYQHSSSLCRTIPIPHPPTPAYSVLDAVPWGERGQLRKLGFFLIKLPSVDPIDA